LKEKDIMDNLNEIIITSVGAILLAFVGVLGVQAKKLLGKLDKAVEGQIETVKDNDTRLTLLEVENKIEDLVVDAINISEQHIVKGLKEVNEDGKLTKEEGLEVLRLTANRVYNELSDKAIETLEEVVEDIQCYLEGRVQSILNDLKKGF
jgi:hypothetical protein